jgi:hypothetical protein
LWSKKDLRPQRFIVGIEKPHEQIERADFASQCFMYKTTTIDHVFGSSCNLQKQNACLRPADMCTGVGFGAVECPAVMDNSIASFHWHQTVQFLELNVGYIRGEPFHARSDSPAFTLVGFMIHHSVHMTVCLQNFLFATLEVCKSKASLLSKKEEDVSERTT